MNDILVIGGGIAGTSVAARLAPHASVTLLEMEDALAYHTSGRSAALFEENYGKPAVKALNRASAAYHKEGGYLSPRGFLLLGTAQDRELYESDLAEMGAEEVGLTGAMDMVPILNGGVVTHAAYNPNAQDIDTDRLVQDFAKEARRHGAQVITGAQVTAITKTAQRWRVESTSGIYETDMIVNAAGAWADEIATTAGVAPFGLTQFRRSVARLPAPGGHDIRSWPLIFGAGETWYAKPDAGKLIVSPAEEHPMTPHDAWADDMVLAEGIARYQAHVIDEVTRVESSWAGLRTFAPDRVLVLGRDPSEPSFAWCAGQGGYGMQSAPGASQLCADLILGRTPEIDAGVVESLKPDRFRR